MDLYVFLQSWLCERPGNCVVRIEGFGRQLLPPMFSLSVLDLFLYVLFAHTI